MRNVQGTENYRMGYGAGLGGFNPGNRDLAGYDSIYPGYAQGCMDGLMACKLNQYAEHQADPRNERMDMVEWMELMERETE